MNWVTNFALATRSHESKEWGGIDFAGKTVRFELPIHIDGDALRMRFANHYGASAVKFEAAVEMGESLLPLEFESDEIPAGGELTSREMPMKLRAGKSLRVYIYLATDAEDRSGVYGGEYCEGRHFCGDFKPEGGCTVPLLASVDVRGEGVAIAAFGDSITQMRLWTDEAERRAAKNGACLLNLGIGGNRLLYDTNVAHGTGGQLFGRSGLARFDFDLKPLCGVKRVLVALGVNDISQPSDDAFSPPLEERAHADELIAGCEELRAKIEGIGAECVFCTVTPFGGMGVYCGETEDARAAFNDWMRTQRCVDFAAAVEDASKPGFMREEYDSGDHLHPSKAGGLAMAAAIPDEYLR